MQRAKHAVNASAGQQYDIHLATSQTTLCIPAKGGLASHVFYELLLHQRQVLVLSMNTTPHTRLLPDGLITTARGLRHSRRVKHTGVGLNTHQGAQMHHLAMEGCWQRSAQQMSQKPITGATRTWLHNWCHEQLTHVRIRSGAATGSLH
jgi:hypothetical protein